jgi:hypothetical protein
LFRFVRASRVVRVSLFSIYKGVLRHKWFVWMWKY